MINDDFEDIYTEPLVFHVNSRALINSQVSWYQIMKWLNNHQNVTWTQNWEAFCTTLEFPARELLLEFYQTFPGLLKGE